MPSSRGDGVFTKQVRTTTPREPFAFLARPPLYFSRIWPKNVRAGDTRIAVGCSDLCNFLPPPSVLLYGTHEQ